MGLIKRNIHGKDFLVYLKEKEQIYLGPKGEYEKGKWNNVKKAIRHNDQKIDKILQKYVEDTTELSLYMPEPERKEYLSKRTAELLARLRQIRGKVPIQVQAQDLEEELERLIEDMVSSFAGNKQVVLQQVVKTLGISKEELDEYLNTKKD